jgi:hypothetical protein
VIARDTVVVTGHGRFIADHLIAELVGVTLGRFAPFPDLACDNNLGSWFSSSRDSLLKPR